jgi:hypothetical protein
MFTYDLSTDVGKVRLEIGDTEAGKGVKPNNGNLSDEELQYWVSREGHVMRAVAAACEALARMWSSSTTISIGPHSETLSLIAGMWDDRAKKLRAVYGDTPDDEIASTVIVPLNRAED